MSVVGGIDNEYSRRRNYEQYETPTITELGSVADFTQRRRIATFDYDGVLFHGVTGDR